MWRGRVEFPRLSSRLLVDNKLGDPSEREVLVYLPPSYDDASRRFPLLMVLPPYASGHRALAQPRVWEPDFLTRYERLVEGGASEAIVVSPDCLTRWGGSQFLDSEATGRYQSYLADEVVPFIDARYRTQAERARRAVVGRSSGGFGALRLALDRPEVFSAYGSHAGDCLFEVSVRPTLTAAAIALEQAGGLVAFASRIGEAGPRPGEFEAVMLLASAAAYAPGGPFPHAQLPFEADTGRLVDEVWARFLAHDPVNRLQRDPDAMKGAGYVFLDAGGSDEHGLHFGARVLAARLRERGVAVEHEEFPGGHRGTAYRYDISVPKLLAALAA